MKISKICAGIVLLIFASIFFVQAFSYGYYSRLGPGPGFFPLWVNAILIVCSLLFILESIKEKATSIEEPLPKGKNLRSMVATIVSLLLFCILVPFAGFVIPCTVMLVVMLLGHYKWYYALAVSLLCSIVILFVFQTFLGIPLPVNEFGW